MLDDFDREELRQLLNHCITRSQLSHVHGVSPQRFLFPDCPRPIWKQGRTEIYDADEFMYWYLNRRRQKTWTPREVRQMIVWRNSGKSWGSIAIKLNRTVDSCYSKWKEVKRQNGVSPGKQEEQAS